MTKDLKDLFVPYEIAVQLKELGFNERGFGFYELEKLVISTWMNTNSYLEIDFEEGKPRITAPIFAQAFDFFREKYNLLNIIDCYISTPLEWFIRIDKISNDSLDYKMDITEESEDKVYLTYEEAEIACLIKLIEITKNKI
jgi:hypothetical protein